MGKAPQSPQNGRDTRSPPHASGSADPTPSSSPTHVMSTRSARARANAISDYAVPFTPTLINDGKSHSVDSQDGDDDADDEQDETEDTHAPSDRRVKGRRAGRPKKTSVQAHRASSPTIDDLIRDQDYHMVDFEDFEDSASTIDNMAIQDIGNDFDIGLPSDIDAGVQQILSGDFSSVLPSIEGPSDKYLQSVQQPEDSQFNTGIDDTNFFDSMDDESDAYTNFSALIGPHPTLKDKKVQEEGHARLKLVTKGFPVSSLPGKISARSRLTSPNAADNGYETDENPMPGSATLRPSDLHQPRIDLARMSGCSGAFPVRGRPRGPPLATFKVSKRKGYVMLDNNGDFLEVQRATAPQHNCQVSKAMEDMANGKAPQPIVMHDPRPLIDDSFSNEETLRFLARSGADLLDSFSAFPASYSPNAKTIVDDNSMDPFESLACIDNYVNLTSEDEQMLPQSVDTSATATVAPSPMMENEAVFAPSTDYVAETSNTQGLMDDLDDAIDFIPSHERDAFIHNPYSSAFEDDSLTSPLFPSQSSTLTSSNKRQREVLSEDEDDEVRAQKRQQIRSGIEIHDAKF